MATHQANTSPPVPKFELGILLVHGIGAHHQPGDTIVRWGDVLLKAIRRATLNKVVVTVEYAGPGDWAGMERVEAAVQLRAGDYTERWLLREAWWADAFPAPSYRELVSWSVRALPWAIVTYIGGRYWLSSSLHWRRRMPALVWLIGKLVLALLLAPVLIILLGLSLLLGLLPIPQVRELVLAVQSRLTATVGDSLAFVESPIRAALIRACILDGLVRLKQVCKRTVIVAHSQGAAVVLDVLGGLLEPGEAREPQAISRPLPDALVTFGAGTNQLASQKVLAAGLLKKFGMNPAFRAVLLILATALMILVLVVATRVLHPTSQDHLWALLWVLGPWLLLMLWLFLLEKLIKDKELFDRFIAPSFVVMLLGQTLYAVYAFFSFNPIFWIWLGLVWAVLSFTQLLTKSILSSEMEELVTAPVRRPPGLARWDDFYASADPVPNGPTRPTGVSDTSIKIWNLGSLFADHTAYWNNRDGFVLRVARVCAETAQSPWASELTRNLDSVDTRAAWRVGFLRMARWSAGLTWLVLLVVLWVWHEASLPVPSETTITYSEFQQMMDAGKIKSVRITNNYIAGTLKKTPPEGRDRFVVVRVEPSFAKQLEEHGIAVKEAVENTFMPDWLPRAPVRFALLVTFIALASWATSVVIRWPWNRWVRREQEAVLAHDYPLGKREAEYPLYCMWTVVFALIEAAFILMIFTWNPQEPFNLADSLSAFLRKLMAEPVFTIAVVLLVFSAAIGWAMLWTNVLLKLKPPPAAPGPSDHGSDALQAI